MRRIRHIAPAETPAYVIPVPPPPSQAAPAATPPVASVQTVHHLHSLALQHNGRTDDLPVTLERAMSVQLPPRASNEANVRPSVLIVMHNTAERLLLKRVCQAEGCEVHTCETGLKALHILGTAGKETYDLCLIDTVLPDVDPRSLCLQIARIEQGGAGCKLNNTEP